MAHLYYMSLPNVGRWDKAIKDAGAQFRPFLDYLYTAKRAAMTRRPTLSWRAAASAEARRFEEHFFQATPSTEDVERLVEEIARAAEAWLAKQGYAGEEKGNAGDDEDAQGVLQMASLNNLVALGERAGKRVRKVVTLGGKEYALGPRCASFDGYNVHANVALAAHGEGPVVRFAPRAPTP